ncbi:efflux transporter outer membrane subunit [Massilia sp. PWRC2]|uniref:efflux transporter outer membrane subunit n=1 Tax=Massilia sp. PWRC2 TaxID=2804626 RepID=UPI003CE9EA71
MTSSITPLLARSALLAAALALCGCATVGSNFQEPVTAAAAAYRHAASADSARLPAAWWTVFNDPTLDALEQRAVRDNPSVLASAQRLLQAQAQLGVYRAAQAPTLSVGASIANSHSSTETSQGIALGRRTIEGNNYQVGAQLSYELDLWGRVRRVVEAADAQALAAQDDRDGVVLMLSSQLAGTYWQLRGLDAEMAIVQRALATRLESEQLIEARFNGGLSNELDLSRARVERANAQADMHELQRQRNALEHALATLAGVSASTPLVPAIGSATLPPPPAIPVGLPASLLAQRPDLAASVANLRAANAQVGVAEGAFYPSLSLTGNFGYASENLRNLATGPARQFSAGPLSIALPIFDGGRNRANLAVARARYDEAVANHQSRLLTALREVEDALSDVEQRQLQAQSQSAAGSAAARAVLVAQARFDRGVSNYLDVTDAQRSSLTADRAAAQIATQRLLAAVAVARSLGAGWQQQAPLATIAQGPQAAPLPR